MEQLYLLEILVDKVAVYPNENDSNAEKKLIIKIKFGPKILFFIKQGHLVPSDSEQDDMRECDENGHVKWVRTIKVGRSFLFTSCPDTVVMTLSKFPLELEVWNDDEYELEPYLGVGTMQWHKEFFNMLKLTSDPTKNFEPMTIKQIAILKAECCCGINGEVHFTLRLTALGQSITTEFQEVKGNPDRIVFRTDKDPTMYECQRLDDSEDVNMCMVGCLYQSTTIEDAPPYQKTIDVCIDNPSAANIPPCDEQPPPKKLYAIEKIKMGDIVGPCGNTNCGLAVKIKNYLRDTDAYKAAAAKAGGKGSNKEKKGIGNLICGKCICKDERWHRSTCPDFGNVQTSKALEVCENCGGITKSGETCEEKAKSNLNSATASTNSTNKNSPKSSNKGSNRSSTKGSNPGSNVQVGYLYSMSTDIQEDGQYKTDYVVQNMTNIVYEKSGSNEMSQEDRQDAMAKANGCSCWKCTDSKRTWHPGTMAQLFNVTELVGQLYNPTVYLAAEACPDKETNDCSCDPVRPPAPCNTYGCGCIEEKRFKKKRKTHKPFCPEFKHKLMCPVSFASDDEDKKDEEEDEDAEPLPYGLPPVQLGPCPVSCRACVFPDGYARMYKSSAMEKQLNSNGNAGKVCCTPEYERIKKAIKEYMISHKINDFKCLNMLNEHPEKRCCEKSYRKGLGKPCVGR